MYKDWWSNTKNCLGKNWFSIFVFIYLIIASVFVYCKGVESFSSETLIVSFVGILATFIVVSNYSQVRDIADKVKELDNNNEKIKQAIFLVLKENALYEIAQNIKNGNFKSLKWLNENGELVDIVDKDNYNSLPPGTIIFFQNNSKSAFFLKKEIDNCIKIIDSLKKNKEN